MSKKKIELCQSNNNFYLEKENVIITGLKDENTFIYQNKCKAQGLLPFYRFLSKEECSQVKINSVVTIYRYFNTSGKRLLAYHVRYEHSTQNFQCHN